MRRGHTALIDTKDETVMKIQRKKSCNTAAEQGQAVVEFAYTFPFLVILFLVVFEMGILFATYLSMVNAAREGAMFASLNPKLVYSSCGTRGYPGCKGPIDEKPYGAITNTLTIWKEYENRIRNDSEILVNNPLIAAGLQGTGIGIVINRPIAPNLAVGQYVTVSVAYTFTTFTSSITLPFFGRMGLPTYYTLRYDVGVPIRKEP
jgi:hypothetical protein